MNFLSILICINQNSSEVLYLSFSVSQAVTSPFWLAPLVLSLSPFSNPLPSSLSVPSSMLNENQTFSRPNQDVLSWMSLIMGWVNSEFRCCRGIKSRDKPGVDWKERYWLIAQWALVRYNYPLLTSEEEEEQIFSGLTKGFEWISKTGGLVNTGYHSSWHSNLFYRNQHNTVKVKHTILLYYIPWNSSLCVCCYFLNSLRESERGFVEGQSFLWIAVLSGPAVNSELCLFCP